MKKFVCKLLAVILLLGALTGVLTACKKEPETTTYSVAMGYKISEVWPNHKVLYHHNYLDPKTTLTSNDATVTYNIAGCPRLIISTRFYVIDNTTGKVVKMIEPPEEYTYNARYFSRYLIDGNLTEPAQDPYDLGPTDSADFPMMANSYQLHPKKGLHKLHFWYPRDSAYGFEYFTVFEININLQGDDRAPAYLYVEESDDYDMLDVGNYKAYIMKHGLKDNKFLPMIGVKNQAGETILEPMFPLEYNSKENAPQIVGWFTKMDEYYLLPDTARPRPRPIISPLLYPKDAGIYLVYFTYTGDETYQIAEYKCYVIIPRVPV